MLYGVNPFYGFDIQEIYKNIERFSGDKLPFNDQVNRVSQYSKDLLRELLVEDPDKRIEWKRFFNHPVFSAFRGLGGNKDLPPQHIEKGPMHASSVDTRTEQVSRSRLEKSSMIEKLPPHHNPDFNKSIEEEISLKENQFRYLHEKNKILLIYWTIKKLRMLMKDPDYYDLSKYIYLLMSALAKKGSMLSELTVISLNQKSNIFHLQGFEEFCRNSREYEEVFSCLQADQRMIFAYHIHLMGLGSEVNLTSDDVEFVEWLNSLYVKLEQIDHKADVFFSQILDLPKPYKLSFNAEENRRYHLAMYMSLLSIRTETMLPYCVGNNKKYEWQTLKGRLESMNPEMLRQAIYSVID